jgi:hypothetical protein
MQHAALAGAFEMFIGTVGQLKLHRQIVGKSIHLAMGRWKTLAMVTAMWAWMDYMEVVAQERKEEALDQARHHFPGMSELVVLSPALAAARRACLDVARAEADYQIRNRSVLRLARPAAVMHQ